MSDRTGRRDDGTALQRDLARGQDEPGIHADVPVLVHVGPYKTGTTWLQERFFPALGNAVLSKDFLKSHAAFLLPRFGEFDPSLAREAYRDALAHAHQTNGVLVISDEALGGNAYGQRFLREIVASRIKCAFPNAKVLVSAREQVSVALSLYSEYLRGGYSSDLVAYLSQGAEGSGFHPLLDLPFWDWDRTFDLYASVFGASSVLVAPMEWILAENDRFLQALSCLVERELVLSRPVALCAVERPSLSSTALHVLMLLNRLHPQDTRYARKPSRFSPNAIAHKIDRLTPLPVRVRGKARQRGIVAEALGDYYATSNRRFSERFGIDLSGFGYRT